MHEIAWLETGLEKRKTMTSGLLSYILGADLCGQFLKKISKLNY